jgi:hypothetical protein
MSRAKMPPDLEFLQREPEPVRVSSEGAQGQDPDDVLSPRIAERLLRIPGVAGAWLERNGAGAREVVVYMLHSGAPRDVPACVAGITTRVVVGERIRAQ